MTPSNHAPTFNMKVVVQKTGLKPDTLRAWERRYGIPNPERTPGGHRLYTQHEIDMLKWLVARQEEGMTISHAVDLWHQLEGEGQNPLLNGQTAVPEQPYISGDQIDELRKAWIDACLEFDEHQAQRLLARAFALFSVEAVCYQILQQGLNEIGKGWYEGSVTVQQEHFASALALRQLEALLAAMPAPTRNGRIIVACPPTELHTFAPLMISLMLRRQGWDVVYLGANVPLDRLEISVRQIKPALVVLSMQTLTAAGQALPLAYKLQEINVPLAFGGSIFNQIKHLKEIMPGHFLGETLAEVPQTVETLIRSAPAASQIEKPSKAYQAAYEHFIERRAAIDAHLHLSSTLMHMPTPLLTNANNEFSNNIEAGLRLGDLSTVEANLEWLKGLLLHNYPSLTHAKLQPYLQEYSQAAKAVMDEDQAGFLLDWLAQLE